MLEPQVQLPAGSSGYVSNSSSSFFLAIFLPTTLKTLHRLVRQGTNSQKTQPRVKGSQGGSRDAEVLGSASSSGAASRNLALRTGWRHFFRFHIGWSCFYFYFDLLSFLFWGRGPLWKGNPLFTFSFSSLFFLFFFLGGDPPFGWV